MANKALVTRVRRMALLFSSYSFKYTLRLTATTRSPRRSSGTPNTAEAASPSIPCSTRSTSAG